jgi:hypothetical protein
MTVPWLMNCPHSDESWCLDCVAELGEELAAATKDARRYRFLRDRAENFTTEWDQVCFSWRVGPRVIMVPPSNDDVDAAIDAVNEGVSRE